MGVALASILDPIQSTLSPLLWDHSEHAEPTLKPRHAHWIKRTIYQALEGDGYAQPHEWLRLVLTGSLTTFQYGETSDCDVSLFVDSETLPEWSRAEMIGVMIQHVDGQILPGTPYPMQDFVVGKQLTPADLYRPGLRSGYDIDRGRWIVPPEKHRAHDVQAEENGFYVYALEQADKMATLLRYEPDKAIQLWHQIHRRRQRDQAAGKGDNAESNIVYKFLAQRGLLPELAELTGEHIARTGAWDTHFLNQIEPIARAYHAMPEFDSSAAPAWQELAQDSGRRANLLRQQLNIQETDDPEPYAISQGPQAMFDDINRGVFKVSRANSEHPIWTPDQNVNFRIVHDVLGHHPSGGDFNWGGENKACGAHFPLLSPNAQRALMTECLGQTGFAIANGGFGPQKVGFMDKLLSPAQQAGAQTFSAMPSQGFCHRHLRHGIYRLS